MTTSTPATTLLCLSLAAIPVAAPGQEAPASKPRPNVVVFYVDDQSRGMVSCYGGAVPTPRIDALARDGVRCDRYYATSAVCSPSRYALLSGRYPSRGQRFQRSCPAGTPVVLGWEPSVVGEARTLPLTLQAAGYRTAMVGKWGQGADGAYRAPLGVVRVIPPASDPGDPEVLATLGRNYTAASDCVKSCGFDVVGGLYWTNIDGSGVTSWLSKAYQVHNPEWVTSEAQRFLDQQVGSTQPFFLYVAITLPHWPRPLESLRKGDPQATPAGASQIPATGMASRQEVQARLRTAGLPRAEDPQHKSGWQEAAASSVWIDESVGAVLDRLDRLDLAKDTLVVYSSDNGFPPGKFTAYEEGSRLPLIMRWPGRIPAGRVSPDLVSTVDLTTTIYGACGVQVQPGMVDGVDVMPTLAGSSPGQPWVYLENACTRAVMDAAGWKYIAVRFSPAVQAQAKAGVRFTQWGMKVDGTERHTFGAPERYPAYFDPDQLYQINEDPAEQTNLAGRPEQAARLAEMRERLTAVSRRLPHVFGEFSGR